MPTFARTLLTATAAAAVALATTNASAEPFELAAQGRMSAAGGGPVADGTYPMGVGLYDQAVGGTALFSELFLAVPVQGGLFALTLGGGATKLDTTLFAAGKPLYVGVTVAADPELARQPLRRVPYAVQAVVAANATDLQCSGCVGSDDLAKAAVTGDKIASGAVGANHVSFAWAAADSAGGPATFALDANKAKLAEKSTNADFAGFADEANQAKLAGKAQALQCTGCLEVSHLSADAQAAFLATKGGTVSGKATFGADVDITGKLTVKGGLDLANSAISGGHFAAVDVTKATCGAGNFGQVVMDTASKRLWMCDGTAFLRISTCTGQCKVASAVACGQPISSDCGDLGGCTGNGSFCASGACVAGKCSGLGEDKSAPGKSCNDIIVKNPAAKTGTFWVDPNGTGAYQVDCDMATSGGGWTRVLKNAERYGDKQAAFKSLADGSFVEMRAVHISGYIACNCGSADVDHPWQACNPSHGDVWSWELIVAGKYVLQQSSWSVLPTQCKIPTSNKADLLCTVNWSVAKGADIIPTWQEPSNNTSLSDNCGTQVIDLWAR